jgi:hypothetical protein
MTTNTNRGSGWQLGLLALLLSSACADSTLTGKPADSGDGAHSRGKLDAGDADASTTDAGRRVKERTVAIDVVQAATRDVRVGADGNPEFGEMVPLVGADVCAVQRRDAYAEFEPFEPIAHPPCTKTVGNDVAHLAGVPANSDVIVTIEYEGLQPIAVDYRTGDFDLPSPGWEMFVGKDGRRAFALMLFKPGAFDRWADPEPAQPGQGTVLIGAKTYWSGSGPARAEALEGQDIGNGVLDGLGAAQVKLVIEPAGNAPTLTTTTAVSGTHLSLPAGSARIRFINDDRGLPLELIAGAAGLKTTEPDTIELPVLPGHDQPMALMFSCAPGPDDGELVDLQACTFAPAAAAAADAGQP